MTILDRYIFREVMVVFLIGVSIVMAILFLEKIHFLSELILDSDTSITDFAVLLIYVAPAFLVVSIPIAILLATLITFSQLSTDNEITAMRSCGVGFNRILAPVLVFSLLVYGVSFYLSVNVQHVGNYKFIKLLRHIITERISLSLRERVFFDKIKDTIIYVSEKPVGEDTMNGIFIFDSHNPEKPEYITATQGRFVNVEDQVVLQLFEGSVYTGDEESFRLTSFESYELVFDTDPEKRDGYVLQPREMSEEEIRARIAEKKEKKKHNFYTDEVEIHKRYSMPFSSIILALLGVPLGIRSQRGTKWSGISLGIGAIILNYMLLMLFEGLGREGAIAPMLAIWLPNILMATLMFYLIYITATESMPFAFLEKMEHVKIRFEKLLRRKRIKEAGEEIDTNH
jgi:lipopolysaccharide export system permease protein